ncbi:MAG: hypothetical protein APR54_13075 [Candidatus Cloacimonas sp. SDB]|nr:MAG: hypothetical protein APR54_13075 [Candidatus Cloacimonas sp. SDB]
MKLLPPLYTRSLIIKQFSLEDVNAIFKMSREISLRTWLPDQVYESIAETEKILHSLINQYDDPGNPKISPVVLGIFLKNSDNLIGHIGLSPQLDEVEIGYAIGEEYQGKGYASEAVAVFSDWCFQAFDLSVIYGITAAANESSCRVLEKSGFILINQTEKPWHNKIQSVRIYQKNN